MSPWQHREMETMDARRGSGMILMVFMALRRQRRVPTRVPTKWVEVEGSRAV